jgi:hypothetical protein
MRPPLRVPLSAAKRTPFSAAIQGLEPAQRSTATSKPVLHARAPQRSPETTRCLKTPVSGLAQLSPRSTARTSLRSGCRSAFLFLLLSSGSYVPAPPAQPSCGRPRSRCLVSALRLFPPTTHPLLALRVAPAPSGTATRCSASRQKQPGGEGKLAGHQSRPTHRILSKGREKP